MQEQEPSFQASEGITDQLGAIIALMDELGDYQPNDNGLCISLARTGIENFFSGELTNYRTLMEYIADHRKEGDGVLVNKMEQAQKDFDVASALNPNNVQLTTEQQLLLNIPTCLRSIDQHQNPEAYESEVGRTITQQACNAIFAATASTKLKQMGKVEKVDSWSDINTQEDFENFGKNLELTCKKLGKKLGFTIENSDHAIGFCYESSSKSWNIIDADDPRSIIRENLTISDITQHLYQEFNENSEYIAFETVVYALLPLDENQAQQERELFKTAFDEIRGPKVLEKKAGAKAANQVSLAYIAAEYGHDDVINALAKFPETNFNKTTEQGYTPLFVAVQHGHTTALEALVTAKADINQPRVKDGFTALFIAARHGHIDTIDKLVQLGANLNQRANNGASVVHIAAGYRQVEAIQKLIALEAEINSAAEDGMTPLHVAAQVGSLDIVKLLVDAGADITQQADDEKIPADLAEEHGHQNIVDFLSEKKPSKRPRFNQM